ncbi:MAG: hypothetical protein ACHP7N_08265 [Caulobacterales bacterium]
MAARITEAKRRATLHALDVALKKMFTEASQATPTQLLTVVDGLEPARVRKGAKAA